MKLLVGSAATICLGQAAYAQTAADSAARDTRGEIYCFPAKGVPKMVERIDSVDAKRRDVVDVKIDPKFIIKDGGVWPDAFYLAKNGEILIDMPISRPDGRVANFIEAIKSAPNSDICVVDPTRADKPEDDEGLYFEMGLSPYFHTSTGEHGIEDLIEGSKDAKTFYKKMIPAALRMFMPDTDYLAVKYDDVKRQAPEATAEIYARVNGQDVAVGTERHKEMFVVSGEALKEMGASALIVRGGDYALLPVPSPSIMRRFGWGVEDDTGNADEAEIKALSATETAVQQ